MTVFEALFSEAVFIPAQPPHWIPAYAGMTAFFELSSSRFATIASPRNALPLIAPFPFPSTKARSIAAQFKEDEDDGDIHRV